MPTVTSPARVLQLVADLGWEGAVAELVDGAHLDEVDARLHVAGVLDDADRLLAAVPGGRLRCAA